MIYYLSPPLLKEVCSENTSIVGEVVEVMTSVLDNEEDDDGHLTCLLITQDLMNKDAEGKQTEKLGDYEFPQFFEIF